MATNTRKSKTPGQNVTNRTMATMIAKVANNVG